MTDQTGVHRQAAVRDASVDWQNPPAPSRLLAVALGLPTVEQMETGLRLAARDADIVELRLDMMAGTDVARLLANRPCPVIVTCRAKREGGHWPGTEGARLDVLRHAIDLGAEYVDIELDTVHHIRDRGSTKLVVSSHDFSGMPPDFQGRYRRIAEAGADVVKVVGMASDALATLPVTRTLADADRPTIAIAMGEAGLVSRVLALRYSACLLTFCTLDGDDGTAPGQMSISELREVYRARSISAETAFYGIVSPVDERLRLRRFNTRLAEAGADAVVVPLLVPEGGDPVATIGAFADLDFRGFRVEPPHDRVVGQAVDTLDRSACRAGSVNSVRAEGEGLVGGWTREDEQLADWLALAGAV